MIPALIGAAGLIGGSLLSGHSSAKSAMAAARFQAEQNERMYRNRHTWEVKDLQKAGLNPILSVTGGQPPTPSVSQPHIQVPDYGAAFGKAAEGFTARMLAKAQEGALKEQERASYYQAQKLKEEAFETQARTAEHTVNTAIKAEELDAMRKDPDAYWRSKYQSPAARGVQDVFELGRSSARAVGSGLSGLWNDLKAAHNAKVAAAGMEARRREADKKRREERK